MTDAAHPLLEHAQRFRVRTYELDQNGHVNNSVYLAWAENLAAEHAEALGFGRAWSLEQGGAWVVRRHEITYHRPAVAGDEIEAMVRVEALGGVRGVRRTWIRRATDANLLAEVLTDWVWVRLSDGRPRRVPAELVSRYRGLLRGS
ncbi:MAG TPA: thioesterase family protein [candidate division Zixibacteria bacterium]|nr:thioesterase family protein [candidate division Zixibacteria bacterium]